MIRRELFVGWIPNVAGRLSFSHIGKSSYPRRCQVENRGDAFGRRIAVAQERKLSDWLLPSWYFRALYGFSANWRFVLVARTVGDKFDAIARVQGEVLVFDGEDWDRLVSVGDETLSPADLFKAEVLPWASAARNGPDNAPLPEASLSALRRLSLFSFSVGIRRTGVLWLRPIYIASDVTFADDYVLEEHAPQSDDLRYLANQAFFFLKDISHNHRHHDPGSDTITEVGLVDHNRTWAISTHYRIHRKVVELRRSKDPEAFYGASGMLAYLSSLRKALQSLPRFERPRGPLSYNNAEIEASIKAETEVLKWRQTQINITKTAFPALSLALIALTGYEDGTFGGFLRKGAVAFSSNHPLRSIGILLVLLVIAPFYYQVLQVHRLPFIVHAKRILVTRAVTVHGIFWLLVSAFMFSTAALQLGLNHLLDQLWAGWLRRHAQGVSWALTLGALGLSTLTVYALPFWPTRHDLKRAMGSWLRTLRS